jgi:hypothetical protein
MIDKTSYCNELQKILDELKLPVDIKNNYDKYSLPVVTELRKTNYIKVMKELYNVCKDINKKS